MLAKHVTKNISAYCHGELSSEDSRQFAEHIIHCANCRAKFEEIKLGVKLAEQLPSLAAPENLWNELEPFIGGQTEVLQRSASRSVFSSWQPRMAAVVAFLLIMGLGGLWFYNRQPAPDEYVALSPASQPKPSWRVRRLEGMPRIGTEGITSGGHLAVGEWLETDQNSRAQIAVASIGSVEVDSNTRVRLLETQPTEHRLQLARGKMSARIWAPPRLFFVDTPSAVAADLGCAYTLEVDDHGASLLRVTSGWVALELKDRESIVPAGAACETRPGVGPGTPYFEDSAGVFRQALGKVDFDNNSAVRSAALDLMLDNSRARDTLTLWHLLSRVEGKDRVRVYDRIAAYMPPPPGVTREGILQLDAGMLQLWRDKLQPAWGDRSALPMKKLADLWFRVRNRVDRGR